MSTRSCSRCKTVAEPTDEFCLKCGLRLNANAEHFRTGGIAPLPPGNEVRMRYGIHDRRRMIMKRGFAVFLVFILAAASFGTWRVSAMPSEMQLHQTTENQAMGDADSGITILLMGVDEASGEEIDVGVRPDSLLVLHLDTENGSCRLLSIPRDSRVEFPDIGFTKINHALSLGGIPLQREVVEDFLSIDIDYFGLVDFDGLSGVVDAVGGITVHNTFEFTLGDDHFPTGDIELDGRTALRFARFRGGPDGDFGRMERQQLVIRGILNELTSASPVQTIPRLIRAIEGHFRTDLTIPIMVNLATQFQSSCTTESLETHTLIGQNAMFHDPLLNQDLWYVVHNPNEVEYWVHWLLTGNSP